MSIGTSNFSSTISDFQKHSHLEDFVVLNQVPRLRVYNTVKLSHLGKKKQKTNIFPGASTRAGLSISQRNNQTSGLPAASLSIFWARLMQHKCYCSMICVIWGSSCFGSSRANVFKNSIKTQLSIIACLYQLFLDFRTMHCEIFSLKKKEKSIFYFFPFLEQMLVSHLQDHTMEMSTSVGD